MEGKDIRKRYPTSNDAAKNVDLPDRLFKIYFIFFVRVRIKQTSRLVAKSPEVSSEKLRIADVVLPHVLINAQRII